MSDNLSAYSATQYEEGIRKTMPFYEAFYSETIDLVRCLKSDVKVWLDTGCGTGSLITRAYPVFPDAMFLLSDPSSEMLGKAKEALKHIPASHLEIVGNIGTEKLPAFSPNKPQVITAILAHHYFDKEERRIATKKCHELLEDGGLYVTFENIYPFTEEGKRIGLERWKAFQLAQGKTEEEANNHISRYGKSFFPITIEEHLNLLKESNFSAAELLWFSNMQAGFYAIK
jgi:tRNA (cmo5U34)-methyltransferase